MFVLLNRSNVVIDIVDSVRYVYRNSNKLTVLTDSEKGQGIIGSDNETIWSREGLNFNPDFTDIASSVQVDKIPTGVIPRAWKYTGGEFVENTDIYPVNFNSTRSQAQTNDTSNINYIAMISGIDLEAANG